MKLDHLNIVVHDLEQAARFFGLFGYEIEDEADLSGEWISKVVGLDRVDARYVRLKSPDSPVMIELIHYRNPPGEATGSIDQANEPGYRHIAFQVDDIEAEVRRLTQAGVRFLSPVHSYMRTGKKIVYGKGPEGILVELAEYPH